MRNNADLGMTLQSMICKKYNIEPNDYAKEQFNSNYNKDYENTLNPIITDIFNVINLIPIKCITLELSAKPKEKFVPHNFILNNGQTLSIRTSKSTKMVAPRVIGQAGFSTLNSFFSIIYGKTIENKQDIKLCFYNYIDELIPYFLDYLLISDYTVYMYKEKNSFKYIILNGDMLVNMNFDREHFSFTRSPDNWLESTTLKYKDVTIAEIQVHKNRTFKFRFNMKSLVHMLEESNYTNETLGITAEKTICDLYSISYPESFQKRYSRSLQKELYQCTENAFQHLPKPIQHTGSAKGQRLGNSKCSYDFILIDNKTLSVKTNIGKYVCPPEVGQPSDKTFYYYFKNLIDEDHINEQVFKNLVINKVHLLIPIYFKFLFDSDYLLWIYKKNIFEYIIIEKDFGINFNWEKSKFKFSNSIEEWNECNTLYYDDMTIGQFQVHRNRNCYKFRFHFPNLIRLIKNKESEK